MIKFTIILRRNLKMTRAEFIEYHRTHHARLFSNLPEVKQYVKRYVQCHATDDRLPGLPNSKIDGTTELWFDDMAGLAGVFESDNYMKIIRPDEAKFLTLEACEFLVATENTVINRESP